MKNLILLDAHAILHRAFHALPDFTSPQGEPTGAIYGFVAFLLKIIRELKPDYIAACYDLPKPTFRHIAYENYKAKRPKMDDALIPQINRSREILNAFEIPAYDAPGFEADDVIGTIVNQLSAISHQLKVIIASGDLDTLQLVKNDNVVVYTLSRGIQDTVIYNEDKVRERYGFGPELIPDYKALKGDPSDNIIGVPGIGDKTAKDLIIKFGTIENLYKALKEDEQELIKAGIKPRTIGLLKDKEEEANFSKVLARIRKDVPISFSLEESVCYNNIGLVEKRDKIESLFRELGFKTFIERLYAKV